MLPPPTQRQPQQHMQPALQQSQRQPAIPAAQQLLSSDVGVLGARLLAAAANGPAATSLFLMSLGCSDQAHIALAASALQAAQALQAEDAGAPCPVTLTAVTALAQALGALGLPAVELVRGPLAGLLRRPPAAAASSRELHPAPGAGSWAAAPPAAAAPAHHLALAGHGSHAELGSSALTAAPQPLLAGTSGMLLPATPPASTSSPAPGPKLLAEPAAAALAQDPVTGSGDATVLVGACGLLARWAGAHSSGALRHLWLGACCCCASSLDLSDVPGRVASARRLLVHSAAICRGRLPAWRPPTTSIRGGGGCLLISTQLSVKTHAQASRRTSNGAPC
jgi:hypothetical protein